MSTHTHDVPDAAGDDILDEVSRLLTALETHPDPAVGEQVTALLAGIDAVHRAGLTHLMDAIRGMAGDAFVNRLTADPAIRLLLMSYDLLAVDRRLIAEEALDVVRGHLHAHGIDVELTDVVGGAVYVRLHVQPGTTLEPELVRHDLEAALSEGLLGFQELVIGGRTSSAQPKLVQMGGRRPANRPIYRRVLDEAELAPGQIRGVDVDGTPVLVANLGGEWCAVSDRCGDSPLPLHFSSLEGAELRCSWHHCRYDLRTGHRTDGGEERLAVYPVVVQDGEVRIAVGVEPAAGQV